MSDFFSPTTLGINRHFQSIFRFFLLFIVFCLPNLTIFAQPAPIAVDDVFNLSGSGEINIQANDKTFDIQAFGQILTFPKHGSLQGGTLYQPNPGFIGTDSFTYRLCNVLQVCSNTATVTLNIGNLPPIAASDVVKVKNNIGYIYYLNNDSDPENNLPFNVEFVTFPQHGFFQGGGSGELIYTLTDLNFRGTDYYFYKITDSYNIKSNVAGVYLIVDDGSLNAGKSCPVVGQPINVSTGNMWLEHQDYSLPGVGEFIKINRFYNSATQKQGLFGLGWTTDYDENLEIGGGFTLRLNMPDGQAIFFGRESVNNPFKSLSPDFYGEIVKNVDETYTLNFKDGRVHQFTNAGKLLWQRDRIGNQTTLSYDGNGNLTGITDPFGRSLSVTMNLGKVVQIADALGVVTNYTYFPDGTLQETIYQDGSRFKYEYVGINNKPYLATVKDALNNVLETHQYDQQGRAYTSERHGGVERYTFDYTHLNDSIPYTLVTDALGRVTKYTFNSQGVKNVVTKVEGNCNCGSGSQSMDYVYDDKFNLIQTTDALGRQNNFTYDSTGNRLTATTPIGTESFTYNQFRQVLTRTDQMGGVWSNAYDAQGKLITATDPLNAMTTVTYTPQGQIATIKDARNKVTSFGYDGQGRLGQITDANGQATIYGYDARSRLVSVTNAAGFVTNYEYDAADRIKKVIDPLTRAVEYGYDLAGRGISMTDQKGNVTSYSYDGAYRLVAVTNALNHTTQTSYDLMSNVTSQTDALGNVTSYQYDNFDRLIKTIYPVADTGVTALEENFEYDQVGNLKRKVNTAGRQTLYDYDAVNRLVRAVDANNQQTLFEYNPRSQMTKVTDAIGQQYLFAYDALGRTLSQSRANSTMSYAYDAVGNQISRTDYKGITTNYVYDNLNRLRNINYPDANENISFTYDALSRLQKATNYAGVVDFNYTKRNQISQVLDVHGRKINYTYDVSGNPNLMSLDDVQQIDYQFDKVNRLQLIKNSEDNTQIDYNYDAANRLTRKILPNGISTVYQYDGMSRLTRLRDFKTNPDTTQTNLYNRQYSYDTASNISQIKIGNQTKNYNYDLIDRLTQVVSSNAAQNESYSFDAVGNRLNSHLSNIYNYLPNNRLAQSQQANFVYDANGNMVSKTDASGQTQYIWDFENRLRQVIKPNGESVNYKYDALGRRSERYTTTSSTKFTYDGDDVILDVNSDGSFVKYVNGLGIDNKISLKANGVTSYFVQDHLGSTTALTDAAGNVISSATYDSFGNSSGNLATRYGYTGREKDETTGLMYYRARWYDSNLGRFISEDPIGFAGGDINLFAYVGNNPQNFIDPSGNQRADRDRPGDQYPGMKEPYNPNKNRYEGDISCKSQDSNPWVGFEVGGNAHFITSGYGASLGTEYNLLTGQICVFQKSTPRVGIGFFAGVGGKVNFDIQNRTPKNGWSDYQPEGAIDASFGVGGHGDLGNYKWFKTPHKKIDRGEDISGSGIGIGVYGKGIGGSVGIDLVAKRVLFCLNSPKPCSCPK